MISAKNMIVGFGAAMMVGFTSLTSAMPVSFGIFSNNEDAATNAGLIAAGQGNTATTLLGLTEASLMGIDVLWALNRDNSDQLPGLGGSVLDNFVAAGGVLVYHDRDVTDAASVLPGAGGTMFMRAVTNPIDVLDGTTTLTNGPGGVIDDDTLDGGNSSRHGWADLATLPTGASAILSTGVPTQIVDFTYGFGDGFVHYSTIPMDFYIDDNDADPFQDIYAPNVVAYAAELVGAGNGGNGGNGGGNGGAKVPVPATLLLMLSSLVLLRRRAR